MSKKRGLGRGLSALMADVAESENANPEAMASGALSIPIEQIEPNPDQPRKSFDDSELDNLAASIREKGIVQPLVVRKLGDTFQIVAGERRWRAAQRAQLHELPVIVRDFSDVEVLEIAIIENVQRVDLNPIEEAIGYRQLLERFGHTQEQLATALGKSRSYIANLLRLLTLPQDVIKLVEDGSLSAGHARALITSENPSELAQKIVNQGLSVRAAEGLNKGNKGLRDTSAKQKGDEKDADTRALEQDLMGALGMKVSLSHKPGAENGQITLHYKSLEQLDDICRRLSTG